MTKNYDEPQSILAGASHAVDITPSASTLPEHTRAVMVTVDDMTITGVLRGNGESSHTTAPLKVGIMYPFFFKTITAVSTGAVKAYF